MAQPISISLPPSSAAAALEKCPWVQSLVLQKENKNLNRFVTYVFTAALFTIAQEWKQLTCPLNNEWKDNGMLFSLLK